MMALDDEWEIVGLQDDDARPGAWDKSPKNANTSMSKHQMQTGSAALEERVKLSPVTPDERTIEDCIAMQRSQHQHIQYLIRQAENTEHRLEDNQRLIMAQVRQEQGGGCWGRKEKRSRPPAWHWSSPRRTWSGSLLPRASSSGVDLAELDATKVPRVIYLSAVASTWCSGAKEETQTGRLCRLRTRRTGALRRTGMHGKMARGSTLRLEAPSTWYSGEEWTVEWEGRG
ncbi:hypothetical protein QBC33DRAFT_33712 [Phialemonium atrogriseum]|uniref:Uncharacterized protein n=1 Tax=Phialemonium atrogriseum TaxID=1093897 RepID=A0AAJ0FS53_9PEZI|nr:uncharacterized protein QBC33DRAFT_33712 [Phialemonium atrogriseum]KAK1772918.1 hypothetical protein QBC33DRAFT_33712 [Phialemonium atrogriseum]